VTNLWVDLNEAHKKIHAQEMELGDLKEAVSYLAGVVENLQDRLSELEKEFPHE
jgi:predicted nuclease with TOPRIM domain